MNKSNYFYKPTFSKALLLVVLISCFLPVVNANLGTFKQNQVVHIRVLANCTSISLTEVTSVNATYIINSNMTNLGGQTFNYNFYNTSNLGVYTYSWNNPCLDCSNGDCGNSFYITANGREDASAGIVVLFVIIFLILIGLTCYFTLYSIGHLVNKDFDMMDLSIDWGIYFVIISLYYLENYYLANPAIDNYLVWLMSIGGITLVLIPIIALILSIANGSFTPQGHKFRIPRQRFT